LVFQGLLQQQENGIQRVGSCFPAAALLKGKLAEPYPKGCLCYKAAGKRKRDRGKGKYCVKS
jgi:hypothetical protein